MEIQNKRWKSSGGETQLGGHEECWEVKEAVKKRKRGLCGDRDVRLLGVTLLITGSMSWSSSAQPGTANSSPLASLAAQQTERSLMFQMVLLNSAL